jgi:heavy metal translocating P-type ATPase
VVATPCPLLLAAPIAIVSGISRAARTGLIVKHGGALEALAGVTAVCFDKTGTVTTGRPTVADVVPLDEVPPDEAVWLAAAVEQLSPHPFAPALVAAARPGGRPLPIPEDVQEIPGEGVRGTVAGRRVVVGSHQLAADGRPATAQEEEALERAAADGASVAFLAVDGAVVAAIHLSDPLREDAADTVCRLHDLGITRTVLVTGDRQGVAEAVARSVGVNEVCAERTPAGKVEAIAAVAAAQPTAMVGDGVNDAPALASADVGIAMGARGATASSEAADVVVTVDRLDRIVDAVRIARRTRDIARQSVLIGMGLSLVAMGFAAGGMLAPVAGALLQEGIDVASIANALRARRPGR